METLARFTEGPADTHMRVHTQRCTCVFSRSMVTDTQQEERVREGGGGWGGRENALVEILTHLLNTQVQDARECLQEKYPQREIPQCIPDRKARGMYAYMETHIHVRRHTYMYANVSTHKCMQQQVCMRARQRDQASEGMLSSA